nr:immune inhibitor A domain-containing protein [Angustibacter aerolatus]
MRRQQTDRIFVVLAEFGNERNPNYPDQDTDPDIEGPTTFQGPLHNAIPEPDAQDNSTVWQADYNRKHYQDLYFGKSENSVASYYKKQSSGRYTVEGQVTDWVKVKYNEARYGRSDGYPCATNVCSNTWALVSDAVNQWVADQRAKGVTEAAIVKNLKSFDKWDRNDYDGDGNFNEPDGYIDHFQIVHAGGDQADGDPQQGEDAIWSHRWFAYYNQAGVTGPAGNLNGGTQIADTGLWVGDYTIQPENGGLSVFTHEFGHDLGLPDHYDTAGGDNGVEYWTLMAQSRLGAKGDALGEKPGDLGAWDKPHRLVRLRDRARRHRAHARPRPARVQLAQGPGRRRPAAQEAGRDRPRRPGVRSVPVVQRHRQRPHLHAHRLGGAARGLVAPVDEGALEHRGLRSEGRGRVRLRVRRGRPGHRLGGRRGQHHQAGREQRHRRRAGRLDPGHLRPVEVRRQDGAVPHPLLDRPRPGGQRGRRVAAGLLRRRHRGDRGRHDAALGRRGVGRHDAGRGRWLQPHRADHLAGLRQLLHRVEPGVHVVRPVPAVGSVQLRLPQHEAELRRALRVPAGSARDLLGHLAERQQHQPAPR